ncbi:MAG: hypothetical protein ABFD89_18240 [Bryobacteraceae bacterium]
MPLLSLLLSLLPVLNAAYAPLRVSVYATADGVNKYLSTPADRAKTAEVLHRFHVSRVFVEGRRGDDYVQPELLREIRDDLLAHGFEVTGAIATVPGKTFGVRQNGDLGWMNFQAKKTQEDIAGFFRENAGIFGEIVIDDFFCTGDTSPESETARDGRSWAAYRQDLMVSLLGPMVLEPARDVSRTFSLIIKYPQWYDRFHLFGYNPQRMSVRADRVWVGTEVRNPETRRMGFVEPSEGYVNYRWIADSAAQKAEGAWFDHIECTAQNFVDQAWQSVLAGAKELTLFSLNDVMTGHPGHELFLRDFDALSSVSAENKGRQPLGIGFYKPVGSDSEQNMYLMDYAVMIGLPVVPTVAYPGGTKVAVLGVQAAEDPDIFREIRNHMKGGGTIVVTPAFLRKADLKLRRLIGVYASDEAVPELATSALVGGKQVPLTTPLEIDGGLFVKQAAVRMEVSGGGKTYPLLTSKVIGRGRLMVWNVRTFSEKDFRESGEHLLAPKRLGLPDLPQPVADELRNNLLGPIKISFEAPTRVGLYLIGGHRYLYNFRNEALDVKVDGRTTHLDANAFRRIE